MRLFKFKANKKNSEFLINSSKDGTQFWYKFLEQKKTI